MSRAGRVTWYLAAMPLRVSPLRTTCTRAGTATRGADDFGDEVRGTLSTLPARMWCWLRMWLRAAIASTVVRNRAAIPMRVSPGRTL